MRAKEIVQRQQKNRRSNPSETELQELVNGIDVFVERKPQYATVNFTLGSFDLDDGYASIAYKPSASRFSVEGKPSGDPLSILPEPFDNLSDAYDRVEVLLPRLDDTTEFEFETSVE